MRCDRDGWFSHVGGTSDCGEDAPELRIALYTLKDGGAIVENPKASETTV